jgi:hypothetical protein
MSSRSPSQVHVLVLVDRERAVPRLDDAERVAVALVELDRHHEQVLEVDVAVRILPPLVVAEDALHQLRWDRRVVLAQAVEVRLGRQPPVLRPLDLGREVDGGRELVRHRQRVADPAQRERLRGEHAQLLHLAEEPELRERGGVERRGTDALHAEPGEARAHLARRLVGERHCQELLGDERVGRDLVRDPVRDRRGLARARAGEDADRSAHRLRGEPLLRVERAEDDVGVHGTSNRREGAGRSRAKSATRV